MLRRLVLTLLAGTLVVTGCTSAGGSSNSQQTSGTQEGDQQSVSSYDRIPDIVNAVKPSVVTIKTKKGLGSGVVYSSNGVIVTNQHVVARGKGPQAPVFDQVTVIFATAKKAKGA